MISYIILSFSKSINDITCYLAAIMHISYDIICSPMFVYKSPDTIQHPAVGQWPHQWLPLHCHPWHPTGCDWTIFGFASMKPTLIIPAAFSEMRHWHWHARYHSVRQVRTDRLHHSWTQCKTVSQCSAEARASDTSVAVTAVPANPAQGGWGAWLWGS